MFDNLPRRSSGLGRIGQITNDQLLYLRSVLGIENFIVPDSNNVHAEEKEPRVPESLSTEVGVGSTLVRSHGDREQSRMVVLVASDRGGFPVEGQAGELLSKMMYAMKMRVEEVFIVEWIAQKPCPTDAIDAVRSAGSRPVVVFGSLAAEALAAEFLASRSESVLFGSWMGMARAKVLVTHSLQDLMDSPEKKRQTWLHLQMVMKCL